MQSEAKTVSEYLETIPLKRREAIFKLRKLCVDILQGYQETMEYGMPCYKKNNAGGIAFASQKQYISLYVLEDVVQKNKHLLQGLSCGKVCIRYTKPEHMDFQVITKLLQDTLKSTGKGC